MEESLGYAVQALAMGVIFIYMILAAQFRSFTLPLAIMVALPLAFVGVFMALWLCGSTLNMFSVIGIIMLMGLAPRTASCWWISSISHAAKAWHAPRPSWRQGGCGCAPS
jgi:multidrug efflux pump subunit AcrB